MKKGRILLNGVLLSVCVLAFLFFPKLVSDYYIGIFVLIGIYGIAATAFNLLLGNTGQVSLGQAAFYGVGAYVSAIATTKLGLSFWLALPSAGIVAGIFGYIVGLTSVRLQHSYLAMATIAFNVIFVVMVDQLEGLTGGVAGLGGILRPGFFGVTLGDPGCFYLVWIVLAIILMFNRNLLHSKVGLTLGAVRQDEIASAALGIRVSGVKLKIFTLSAFYTGIAGSLFAHYARHIGPGNFQIHFSITLLIMVLLGGARHAFGGILGAAIVVFLPEFLSFLSKLYFLPPSMKSVFGEYSYHLIIYGILLFLICVFAPVGLAGMISALAKRVSKLASKRPPFQAPADCGETKEYEHASD